MSQLLFVIGSALFVLLGVAHGLLTIRDLGSPRAFTPTDDSVRLAMAGARLRLAPQTTIWRAWMGFNLSHSLGLLIFGGFLAGIALHDFDVVARSAYLKGAAALGAVLYFLMALRFWFWLPATLSGVGAACFMLSIFGT